MEDEPPPPQPADSTQGVRRRGAVSAEAVTEEDIANYKKVVSPQHRHLFYQLLTHFDLEEKRRMAGLCVGRWFPRQKRRWPL